MFEDQDPLNLFIKPIQDFPDLEIEVGIDNRVQPVLKKSKLMIKKAQENKGQQKITIFLNKNTENKQYETCGT